MNISQQLIKKLNRNKPKHQIYLVQEKHQHTYILQLRHYTMSSAVTCNIDIYVHLLLEPLKLD